MPEKVLPRPFQHASAKVGLYFVRFPKQKDPVKRCPECRRDYYDETIFFCLDDGSPLLNGPAESSGADDFNAATIPNVSAVKATPTGRISAGGVTEVLASSVPKTDKRRSRRWLWFVVLTIAILGIAGGAGYRYLRSTTRIESVAVMPFDNDDPDPEAAYLSDGMTETLIESLSQLPDLKVKSRASVFRYKDRTAGPTRIGSDLNVQAILNGRLVHRASEIVLYLELIETATENVLWKADYRRQMGDLASLQEEIARDVAAQVEAKLSGSPSKLTQNAQAYELYLKGRYHWNKRTDADLKQAGECFQKAIDLDPAFSQAYTGLAETYTILSYYSNVPAGTAFPIARQAAERALQLDPASGVARADLAYVKFNYEWDFDGAIKDFEQSVRLAPNEPTPHFWFGECLMYLGNTDEGIKEIRKARDLDPVSLSYNSSLGWAYYIAGRSDEAIDQLNATRAIDDTYPMVHFYLGMAYDRRGRYDEAIAASRRSVELSGGYPGIVALGHAYASAGLRADALKTISDMESLVKAGKPMSPIGFAIVYSGLGDKDNAFEWLDKAFRERDEGILYLKCQPYFENLRGDPRYSELLRRIGLNA